MVVSTVDMKMFLYSEETGFTCETTASKPFHHNPNGAQLFEITVNYSKNVILLTIEATKDMN